MLTFKYIIQEMRIKQWTKNLLVYAAIIFAGELLNQANFFIVTNIFFSFCLVSSGVYFINDIIDIDIDRLNPKKQKRPIALGKISIKLGGCVSIALFLAGLCLAYHINIATFFILISYVFINLLYTLYLKNIVIIDVMIIAYGFVARAFVGAIAINKPMTMWFMLCVMFLSLFLALGKRRHELWSLQKNHLQVAREVLQYYSIELIDQLMTIVTSAIILCYALFAMDEKTKNNIVMIATIPLVIYGVFYYLYVVRVKHSGGTPDEALYKEKSILITVLLYIVSIVVVRNII